MSRIRAAVAQRFQDIPVSSIVEPDFKVRKHYDPDKLNELAKSVSEHGVLQPVVVQVKGGKFELIIGSRRLYSAKQSKARSITACIIGKVEDKDAIVMALVENLQRHDLTPFEDAWGFFKLIKDYGMSIQEIAKRIGCGESFVRKRVKLLSIPEELQAMIANGELSVTHVDPIASVASPDEQKRIAKEVTRHRLSQTDIVTYIKEEQGKKEKARVDKSLTGKRVELRIKRFADFVDSISPHVLKMGGNEIDNIKLALERLVATAQNTLKVIEES